MEPLGHVVEEIGDAALRIGIDDDPEGAAVGQIPDLLDSLDRLVGCHEPGLPGAEIRLFRQVALGAQAVEHFRIARSLVEEGRFEAPQMPVGGIMEGQSLGAVEDRHGCGQLVERAGVGLHLARQVGAHAFQLRQIDGLARRAARAGDVDGFHQVAPAGVYRMDPLLPEALVAAGGGGGLAVGALQQFDSTHDGFAGIARLDGARIGGVHPGERTFTIAGPNRARRCIEQAAQCVEFGERAGMALAQAHQFEPVARHIADAQHGPAANGPALGFQMAAAQAVEGNAKTLAPAAQPLDAGFKFLG